MDYILQSLAQCQQNVVNKESGHIKENIKKKNALKNDSTIVYNKFECNRGKELVSLS